MDSSLELVAYHRLLDADGWSHPRRPAKVARELADGAKHVRVNFRARLQPKPSLLEHLDRLNDHVHAVGLIAGSWRADLRPHLAAGEGGEIAALRLTAIVRWTATASGRAGRCAAGGLPQLWVVLGYVAIRHVNTPEAAPASIKGAMLTGAVIPLRGPGGRAGTAENRHLLEGLSTSPALRAPRTAAALGADPQNRLHQFFLFLLFRRLGLGFLPLLQPGEQKL